MAAGLLLPRLWDLTIVAGRITPPFDATRDVGVITFDANDLLGVVVTPIVLVVVSVFLRRSDAGTAIRASADSADRAALLGVPVARLQTLVWSLTGALAFAAVFLRSGILDLPTGSAIGFGVLLRALVALLLGRMTNLVAVTSAAVALGVLEMGIGWDHEHVAHRPDPRSHRHRGAAVAPAGGRPVDVADAAAWRAADEVRPVPALLAATSGARLWRWGAAALVATVALALPIVLRADQEFRAAALLIYAVLGLSLVLLSGWGGIVSLGQMAFFAIGAAVTGFVVSEWEGDLFAGLVIAMVVGAVVAVLVGVPAVRLRGLYLAVTTFAFALATTSYLLERRLIRLGADGPHRPGPAARRLRGRVRAGRLLPLAGRAGGRHRRAARACGPAGSAGRWWRCATTRRRPSPTAIDPVRVRLAAFALSGAVAALAGGLFVHHERAFDATSYAPIENLVVLTMVVVGGMTSLAGAVLGALFLLGTRWFLAAEWQILASGLGVLLVLLLAPGGLAGLVYRGRDRWLRLRRRPGRAGDRRLRGGSDSSAGGDPVPSTAPRARPPMPTDARHRCRPHPRRPRRRTDPGGADLLLDVADVEVGYGGVPVLTGVDLAVREGEAVALLGTNGAGKSTLLRAISALVPPTSGAVRFAGTDLAGLAPHQVAARGIVQMPGGAGVFPSLTVAENLRVAGWLHRRDATGQVDDLRRVHDLFPVLAERADELAGNLSGGAAADAGAGDGGAHAPAAC